FLLIIVSLLNTLRIPGSPLLPSRRSSDLRPHAERWVVGLFLDKVLDRRHFSRTSNGYLMGKEGRQRYYSAYEMIHKHWQKILAGYARVLAKQVDQWAQSQQVLR